MSKGGKRRKAEDLTKATKKHKISGSLFILKSMSPHVEKGFRSKSAGALSRFPNGLHGTVVDVTANPELQGRLMGMGLFAGTRFQLLRSGSDTSKVPFLLAIGETRIALDYDIAETILVEP
jgi:Fe2+ transport system protein FeoA